MGSRRRRRSRKYAATLMTSQAPLGGYNARYGNQQQHGAPPGPPPQYGNTTGNYDGYYGSREE
jgi:hypothetical protein